MCDWDFRIVLFYGFKSSFLMVVVLRWGILVVASKHALWKSSYRANILGRFSGLKGQNCEGLAREYKIIAT
jgi:hypothetical protein